jgi:hypothetical protein
MGLIMSNSAYDIFLDKCVDEYYEDEEPLDLVWDDEPATYPEDDYVNYDGWDDMQ